MFITIKVISLISSASTTYGASLAILDFFSTGSIVLLIVLAVIFQNTGIMLSKERTAPRLASVIAALMLLATFYHCYMRHGDGSPFSTLEAFLRAVLASTVSYGATLVIYGIMKSTLAFLSPVYQELRRRSQKIAENNRERRERLRTQQEQQNQPEPEPDPPRSQVLRTLLEEAETEFSLEAKLITETADLDQGERDALMLAAKQRYIQKVNEILQ
ncbi:hypothetical protein Pan241w_35990 [Gimesia alba]|uniref:Uncharacterized protein n=1 Tax=Gimesia alba TaxID=2527973 RepID=A0A517RI11_9PLAN|nr:hypothetical protein [Gimesia alba]QDT43498.1 hypothetical protein Pan241w_35990 [Gimesia alba]